MRYGEIDILPQHVWPTNYLQNSMHTKTGSQTNFINYLAAVSYLWFMKLQQNICQCQRPTIKKTTKCAIHRKYYFMQKNKSKGYVYVIAKFLYEKIVEIKHSSVFDFFLYNFIFISKEVQSQVVLFWILIFHWCFRRNLEFDIRCTVLNIREFKFKRFMENESNNKSSNSKALLIISINKCSALLFNPCFFRWIAMRLN